MDFSKYKNDLILKKLGSRSGINLISSKEMFNRIKEIPVIIMACNIRIKHVVPGIMKASEELNSIMGFELAKSEGNLSGGYTGQTPEDFVNMLLDYADKYKYSMPFFIHADHITVKDTSEKSVEEAKKLIEAQIKAGYTSYAIDASFNEIPDNIKITTYLSKEIIDNGFGLETEVGEVKSTGQEAEITTVEEAVEYIEGLRSNNVFPQLLAINNGSKHGNYKPGEEVHIDLKRTLEIYNAIKKHNVCIAQHGITGTPLNIIGQFADCGIRKGNVGTEWQNVAHRGLPPELMKKMKMWAENNGKDIKFATKEFKKEIDDIPSEYSQKIMDEAYLKAKEFILAFRSKDSANLL
ncbi:MAG: fructose-bisphosphate aldolase, class-II [candidate division TA06 bacterium 32_111]|uniref:Fructose-bisphosphate aldolase, class-II n=2 Tax=Bacteria candidate phyla TaxID=1783234 RepID=A0A124G0I7_UNCT6|nr:MAG: fructose-bisphosphate aldolase, class-II [candidate division TA06 bacterium 32_111]KUK87595.1 MAG: fructose-bisphosphate aldolase, class-II [candidate division TA06 bacterium 34_109]HAF07434.1 fructose-bisphosphate aldolase [candidate division WOR-3 bacterium]HCP17503.1 fructose-bisphosphate aldolase [candidate division WOR-3 bacterium]